MDMILFGFVKKELRICFFLFNLVCFKSYFTLQYSDYLTSAICQNETVEIYGHVCKSHITAQNEYCISQEKFKSIINKFDDCKIVTKSSNDKTLIDSELIPRYDNLHKRIWRRQLIPDSDGCEALTPPKSGKMTCSISPKHIFCVGICSTGYTFDDGLQRKVYKCINGGPWIPSTNISPCKPQCNPSCQNLGECSEINVCSCPNEFRGELCQYPVAVCGVTKTSKASSWQCNHTKFESRCRISCHPPGSIEAANNYYIHTCNIHGVWNPPLPPCVTSHSESLSGCSDPGVISNGNRNVTFSEDGWFVVGSALRYFCNENTVITGSSVITCQANGHWSSTKPICSIAIETEDKLTTEHTNHEETCSEVVYPKNTEIRIFFPNSEVLWTHVVLNTDNGQQNNSNTDLKYFPVGTKIQYKCKSRYYKLYGSEYQTCQSSGVWSGNKPVCLADCGKSESPRTPLIVGGQKSEAGMWPWQVALSLYQVNYDSDNKDIYSVVCSGSLISEKYVLTAAHCVAVQHSKSPLSKQELLAHFGKHSRDSSLDDSHVQTRTIRRIIINDDYDFVKFEADIALLELDKAVELTTRVQPICLPTETTARDNLRPGQLGVITGWGLTEDGTFSKELRETTLAVVSREDCEESYHQGLRSIRVSERMICAGGEAADTCSGDSGGPFAFLDPESPRTWVLEGIISWGSGSGCGRDKEYSGFTKVVRFNDWIKTYL